MVKHCSQKATVVERTSDYIMVQLVKHYMVKKQSTWYLRQVSLMVASAWPSPQGLHVSHSPAIQYWTRAIATTEYVQRGERESMYETEEPLW